MIVRVKPLIYEGVNIPKGSENDGTVPWGTQKMNKNGAVLSMGKMMNPKVELCRWMNCDRLSGAIRGIAPKKALDDFEQFE